LDADEHVPEAELHLSSVHAAAQDAGDVEVALLSPDALAHCRADSDFAAQAWEALHAADTLLPAAARIVVDGDRMDAHATRSILRQSWLAASSDRVARGHRRIILTRHNPA